MSEWLSFVRDYSIKHNISYGQAMKEAREPYKKRNEPVIPPKRGRGRPRKIT